MLSQTAQEAMRVVAPALAGVLVGLAWFGAGGVFLLSAGTSTIAALVLLRPAEAASRERRDAAARSPRWPTPSGTSARARRSASSP